MSCSGSLCFLGTNCCCVKHQGLTSEKSRKKICLSRLHRCSSQNLILATCIGNLSISNEIYLKTKFGYNIIASVRITRLKKSKNILKEKCVYENRIASFYCIDCYHTKKKRQLRPQTKIRHHHTSGILSSSVVKNKQISKIKMRVQREEKRKEKKHPEVTLKYTHTRLRVWVWFLHITAEHFFFN